MMPFEKKWRGGEGACCVAEAESKNNSTAGVSGA